MPIAYTSDIHDRGRGIAILLPHAFPRCVLPEYPVTLLS